jgi:hypothetical protein
MTAGARNYPDIQIIDPTDHVQGHQLEISHVSEERKRGTFTDLHIQIQIPVLCHLRREDAPEGFSKYETVSHLQIQ